MEKGFFTEQVAQLSETQLFEPTYINLGYIYNLILDGIISFFKLFLSPIVSLGTYENPLLKNIFWGIVLFLIGALIYVSFKYYELREMEKEVYGDILENVAQKASETDRNIRWEQVLVNLDSINEADWRVGIMEADNMLSEMLDAMEYHGDTIGEKLKSIEQSDFLTLSQAWEAHKFRNKIAHEGASFTFTKREADRIIDFYRQVFEEFKYI